MNSPSLAWRFPIATSTLVRKWVRVSDREVVLKNSPKPPHFTTKVKLLDCLLAIFERLMQKFSLAWLELLNVTQTSQCKQAEANPVPSVIQKDTEGDNRVHCECSHILLTCPHHKLGDRTEYLIWNMRGLLFQIYKK